MCDVLANEFGLQVVQFSEYRVPILGCPYSVWHPAKKWRGKKMRMNERGKTCFSFLLTPEGIEHALVETTTLFYGEKQSGGWKEILWNSTHCFLKQILAESTKSLWRRRYLSQISKQKPLKCWKKGSFWLHATVFIACVFPVRFLWVLPSSLMSL